MNDDKVVEEMKIFFADFKMLGTKINDDNKNKKKNKYSCSGSPAFKSGSCRLRFSQLLLCYK